MDNKNIRLIAKDLVLTPPKVDNPDVVTISGYANKYISDSGQVLVDHSQESVLPSSYDLGTFKKNPIILFNHRMGEPIGKAVNVDIRADGLYIEAEIHKVMDEKAFYGVVNGILKTFSISFSYKDGKYVNDIFYFTDIELLEISVVTIPDNNESLFSVLTQAPCGNGGTCLLAKEPTNKKSLEYKLEKSVDIDDKEWKSVDKAELKSLLKELNKKELIEDAFLVADIEDEASWKFPHHTMEKDGLKVNRQGLDSALSALKSLQDDSAYSYEVQIEAWKHIEEHYKTLEASETVAEIELKLKDLQDSIENTINSKSSDQEPGAGEENESDTTEMTKETILSAVEALKASDTGLDDLLEVYGEIESVLNEALNEIKE